ncbi:hypothetical protein KM043_014641 [Ampulex compressa]|nr:hypothetical protein KM043_014641 [Ampulex compressa]
MGVRALLVFLAVVGAMAAAVTASIGLPGFNRAFQLLLITLLLPILCRFHRRIYVILRTLPRDLKFVYRYINVERDLKKYERDDMTAMKIFRERAREYPTKPCFIFEERIWSNAEINEFSNRLASVFQKSGHAKGDAVALMMPNRPEYIAIWLGLGKLGVITALINTNLRLQSLVHCINVAKVKSIIYFDEYASAIDGIAESIKHIGRYRYSGNPDKAKALPNGTSDLNKLMLKASTAEPVVEREPGYKDILIYIYTSGTTGLPKVALLPNSRYLLTATVFFHMLGLRPSDVLYNVNPLYHMSGGVLGTGCALIRGVPSVLKSKFSVTSYWTDCIKYNCTLSQYIGEMCRYLLSAPPRPEDSAHAVRIMVGNGMKPQIWDKFVKRFSIEQVAEIYGSSEGNANMVNLDSQFGAVGFVPSFFPKSLHPFVIIRVHPETYEPIRGPNGLCIRAEIDEPGMLVGLIKEGKAIREFSGYLDKEASRKKTIENVLKEGDRAYLSGDILVQDEYGYFYFKDRIGDTFRWKGENVATAEVESIISQITNQMDAIVYGVEIPGMEGRAGMAAIGDPQGLLDLKEFAKELEAALPSYARPIFLRIAKEIEITSTFKLRKVDLQKEGFDPGKIQDKMYLRHGSKGFVELTEDLYREILSGSIKL